MIGQVVAVLIIVAAICLVVLGAYLWHKMVGTPSDRERALEAQLDAMKRANYLGAEFFNASQQMRDAMAGAADQRARTARSRTRPARATAGGVRVGDPTVIDADWHD